MKNWVVIKMGSLPILWHSKPQTQIHFSSMEVEYIALSESVRVLVLIKEMLKEIYTQVYENFYSGVYSLF